MHSGMDDPEGPGFPIQTSQDQRLVANSPGLIAGSNVFHRLLTPSHPPHTLSSLITPTCDRRQTPIPIRADPLCTINTQRPIETPPQTDSRATTSKHLICARTTRYHTTNLRATPRPFHLSKNQAETRLSRRRSSPRWLRVVEPAMQTPPLAASRVL